MDFTLVCDEYGAILECLCEKSYGKCFNCGENLSIYIEDSDIWKYLNFLKKIKEDKYLLGYEMSIKWEGKIYSYNFNGYHNDNKIIVIALSNDSETLKLLKEIMVINNECINNLREALSEKHESKGEQYEGAYEEISKLNNELLNSKRLIEKQNIKLIEYNKLLEDLTMKDVLTAAFNRRYFYKKIYEEIDKAKKENENLCLASIDFNNFKVANDKYGHDFGDKILKLFVEIANNQIRNEKDYLFRIGGDEFIILFYGYNEEEALKCLYNLNTDFYVSSKICTIAYGTVLIEPSKISEASMVDEYIKVADKKMYECKKKFKLMDIKNK